MSQNHKNMPGTLCSKHLYCMGNLIDNIETLQCMFLKTYGKGLDPIRNEGSYK